MNPITFKETFRTFTNFCGCVFWLRSWGIAFMVAGETLCFAGLKKLFMVS